MGSPGWIGLAVNLLFRFFDDLRICTIRACDSAGDSLEEHPRHDFDLVPRGYRHLCRRRHSLRFSASSTRISRSRSIHGTLFQTTPSLGRPPASQRQWGGRGLNQTMTASGRKRTLASEPTSALPQYPLTAKSGHRRRTRRSPAFCLAGNAAIRCCEVRPASPLPNTCGACCGLTLVSRCGAHASAASRRNVVTATQPRCTTHSPSALSPIAPAIGRGQASAIFDSVRADRLKRQPS